MIETTGLADPAPILHTLMSDPLVAARYMLDGVVTTVDAVNGAGTLDRQLEAVKQAAVADRLLLTKTDLADRAARGGAEGAARARSTRAPRSCRGARRRSTRRCCSTSASTTRRQKASMCSAGCATRLSRRGMAHDARGDTRHEHADVNRHDDRIRAFCITRERPISWAALSTWLDALATMRGDDLLRLKAIVALPTGPSEPVVVHGVQHLFHPPVLLPDGRADHRTRMVFITRDLPREAIEKPSPSVTRQADKNRATPPAPLPLGGR